MHVHVEQPMQSLLDLFLVNGATGVRDLNSESFFARLAGRNPGW
jgi:hypothetical protein